MMIPLLYYDEAHRFSDETCFIFEIYPLVELDNSKMLVFIGALPKIFFCVERSTLVFVSKV